MKDKQTITVYRNGRNRGWVVRQGDIYHCVKHLPGNRCYSYDCQTLRQAIVSLKD